MASAPANRVYRLMWQAIDDLPPQYAERLDNVEFLVRRHPFREQRRHLRGGSLYGLYEGVALTHRGSHYGEVTPDRITLFWGTLVRDFPDDGRLEREVRNTVYHEIAHYFGLDEDDLEGTRVK
jgi:predicted Zn-dependent protease with MMP-like domain